MRVQSSNFFVPKQGLRKAALVAASALAIVLVAAQAKAEDFVLNGSFEQTSGGTNQQIGFNGFTLTDWSFPTGAVVVTNNNPNSYGFVMTAAGAVTGATSNYGANNLKLWTVANGGHDVITASPDGGNFVAVDGAFPTPVQPLQQTINGLTPGQNYTLSFDWAAAQQHGYFGATTEAWSVSLGGETEETSVYHLGSNDFSGWINVSETFTATSASEVLSFLAVGTPGESEPPFVLLDGVSLDGAPPVNSPIPEPGTLTLLLTGGMTGLGALSRRRWMKKAVKTA